MLVSSAFWWLPPIYAAVINLVTYQAFRSDKQRAKSNSRRIPERTLLWLAAAGGSIGAIIAQQQLRHKTRKQPFATLLLA